MLFNPHVLIFLFKITLFSFISHTYDLELFTKIKTFKFIIFAVSLLTDFLHHIAEVNASKITLW